MDKHLKTSNAEALMALDYETHHTQNQMIHDFGGGNKIIVDWKAHRAYKVWGNELKDSFDVNGMGVPEFECIIIAFGNQINPLKRSKKDEKRIVQNQKSID